MNKNEMKEKEYYEPAKWIDNQTTERLKKKIKELEEMLVECRKALGTCMNKLQEKLKK